MCLENDTRSRKLFLHAFVNRFTVFFLNNKPNLIYIWRIEVRNYKVYKTNVYDLFSNT